MSPHYLRAGFSISTCERPATIYDFDDDTDPEKRKLLQQLSYPCPGSPAVAKRAASLLRNAGIECAENKHRGLDHGVWTPLYLMYPEADIPVISISVSSSLSAAEHIAAGRALAPLVADGVLIVGSGEVCALE
jgi:4,5-DOPA dioxygenase extradiol